MRAIITRGLYFFTPFSTAVYIQKRLILQTVYVLKQGNSSKKIRGLYSRAVSNQERVIMARVRYLIYFRFIFLQS